MFPRISSNTINPRTLTSYRIVMSNVKTPWQISSRYNSSSDLIIYRLTASKQSIQGDHDPSTSDALCGYSPVLVLLLLLMLLPFRPRGRDKRSQECGGAANIGRCNATAMLHVVVLVS
eukprot:758933-Hanusia_phi.AAC.2